MSKEQSLVNAQVEVRRSVDAMNKELNHEHIKPGYIRHCIDEAISDLKKAQKGYPLMGERIGRRQREDKKI